MNLFHLVGTSVITLSVMSVNQLAALAAVVAPNNSNNIGSPVNVEKTDELEKTKASREITSLDQNETLMASAYDRMILIYNNSDINVVYRLGGTTYTLGAGEFMVHYFDYYGNGTRQINFDACSWSGWQNRSYLLRLGSSYYFDNTSQSCLNLYSL